MSNAGLRSSAAAQGNQANSIRVDNWALRDEGFSAWLIAMSCLAVPIAAGVLSKNIAVGAICFVALCLSARRLWFPVTFEFDRRGFTQSVLGIRRRILWRDVRRIKFTDRGIVFLGTASRSRIAVLRGIYVRDKGFRDQILELVRPGASANSAAHRGSSVASTRTKTYRKE